MVASDRVSAFDVIMAEPIADKGRVLTAMTAFWCEEMADVAPGTIWSAPTRPTSPAALRRRCAVPAELGRPGRCWCAGPRCCHIECIVRGYLAGQAYEEYERSGTVHGTAMPAGLRLADRLAEPIFTPSTKATEGHDLNIDFAEAVDLVGAEAADAAAETSASSCYAPGRGPGRRAGHRHLADTKFELGYVDGALSPVRRGAARRTRRGSGRPTRWCRGPTPPAFDKQPLRDWLAAQPWDRTPPPPPLPDEVTAATVGPLRRRPTSGSPAARWTTGTVPNVAMRFSGAGRGAAAARDRRPRRAPPSSGPCPRSGFDGVAARAGRASPSASRSTRRRRGIGPGQGDRAGRPPAGQPGHRAEPVLELDRPIGGLMAPRIGVVVFPGTNCEHDVVLAVEAPRRPRPSCVWHGDDRSVRGRRRGAARRVRPRRLPAPRGARPLLAGHGGGERVRRAPAARWSASATASRC